jgi:hypothetical protein
MFMVDVETLGVESTSVVLSAAITRFDFTDIVINATKDEMVSEYNRFVMTSKFVKFDAEEQRRLGRVETADTISWWAKQCELAKQMSVASSDLDVSVKEGIARMRSYINSHGGNNQIVWARGNLDQMALDSLCRSVGEEPLFMYNMWRDVRTAVDLLATDSRNGYAVIPNFNHDLYVTKHIPQNDCALDILQMLYMVEHI